MASTKNNKNSRTVATRTNARRSKNLSVRNSREKKLIIAIAALAVCLLGSIGVAVAAFSTDLYIRGTATVRSSVWDVHFENLQPATITGTYAQEITPPTIQTSVDGNALASIKSYEVELKEPGDSIEYVFEVVNAGDMNAVLNAITINTGSSLSCSSAMPTEATNVCSKLNYTLTYDNGTAVAPGDTLDSLARKQMKLKLEFDPSVASADLPTKDVAVSGLAVILSYGQAN